MNEKKAGIVFDNTFLTDLLVSHRLPIDNVRKTVGHFHQYEIGTGCDRKALHAAYDIIRPLHKDTLICAVENREHPQYGQLYLFLDSLALQGGPLSMKRVNGMVIAMRAADSLTDQLHMCGGDKDHIMELFDVTSAFLVRLDVADGTTESLMKIRRTAGLSEIAPSRLNPQPPPPPRVSEEDL